MIVKQTKCEVCKRKYSKPIGQFPNICTACRHKPEAKALIIRPPESI